MDEFFGGIFDFNGDGKTDWIEQAVGLAILDEMEKEDDLLGQEDDARDS